MPLITWEKKTPSGAFSWLTSHVCTQAEILPPLRPMVTLCVGEELTVVNAPLRFTGYTAVLSPFLSRVEMASSGGVGGEPGDG